MNGSDVLPTLENFIIKNAFRIGITKGIDMNNLVHVGYKSLAFVLG